MPAKPAYAAVNLESEVILFTADEWGELKNKLPDIFAQQVLLRLNARRDLIGKFALKIVHPYDNVVYQRTDSVFVAPRDGGGYVYCFIIHWFRDVVLGFGKNLTTKITWEVLYNQHLQAKIAEDNSIFSPVNSEKLEKFFREIIVKKNNKSYMFLLRMKAEMRQKGTAVLIVNGETPSTGKELRFSCQMGKRW